MMPHLADTPFTFSGRRPGALQPSYFDAFPHFSAVELAQRLHTLPFHLATLLQYRHMRLAAAYPLGQAGLYNFFGASAAEQRAWLAAVLLYEGLAPAVVETIGQVERHRFAPPQWQAYSYLNEFVPFSARSCLSPPGLVALMLQQLQPQPGERILEIGAGSGYHLACLAAQMGYVGDIVGVEVNEAFHRFSLERLNPSERGCITLVCGDETHAATQGGAYDRIYATCTMPTLPLELAARLRPGGVFQVARALISAEFEQADDWLQRLFPNHAAYLAGNWQQIHACLTLAEWSGANLTEQDHLYNTIFVYYRSQATARTTPDPLSERNPFAFLSRFVGEGPAAA